MSEKANELKAQGNAAFQAGKFEDAVALFTQAIELNPSDHVFYSNRSGAYASLKQYEKALEDATTCVSLKPNWAKGYQRKGLAEFYLEDIAAAIETYKKGLEIEPGNAQLKEGLESAEAKLNQGGDDVMDGFDINAMLKNPQAMQKMLKLMSNPETKALFEDPSFMGMLQVIMKNPAMAAQLAQTDPRFKKVMDVLNAPDDPNTPDFASMFAGAGAAPKPPKKDSKKEEEAPAPKEAPKPAEKPKPAATPLSPAEEWKAKGNAEYAKKNFTEALKCYDEAIKLNSSEVLYYSNKAAAYIELGDLENALASINVAVEMCDSGTCKDFEKKAKILARKASVLSKQQNFPEAIALYERSLIEDNKPAIKDELLKVKKLKKEADDKAYINPELAEKHCDEGNRLFKEGKQ